MQAERVKRVAKATAAGEIADYNVDRVKLLCRSPRIVVRFMDGEAVFTHVGAGQGPQCRSRIAGSRIHVPLAQRGAAAGRLPRIRSGDPRARNLPSTMPGNGRIVRCGRMQQAHGHGTAEQRSRARGGGATRKQPDLKSH